MIPRRQPGFDEREKIVDIGPGLHGQGFEVLIIEHRRRGGAFDLLVHHRVESMAEDDPGDRRDRREEEDDHPPFRDRSERREFGEGEIPRRLPRGRLRPPRPRFHRRADDRTEAVAPGVVPGEALLHDRLLRGPRGGFPLLFRADRRRRRHQQRHDHDHRRRAAPPLEPHVGGRIAELQFDVPALVADPRVDVGDKPKHRDERHHAPPGQLPVPGEQRPPEALVGVFGVENGHHRSAGPQACQLIDGEDGQHPSQRHDHHLEGEGGQDPPPAAGEDRGAASPDPPNRSPFEEDDRIDEGQGNQEEWEGKDKKDREPPQECLVDQERAHRPGHAGSDPAPIGPPETIGEHRQAEEQRQRRHRPRRLEGEPEKPTREHPIGPIRTDQHDIDQRHRQGADEERHSDPGAAANTKHAGQIEALEDRALTDGDPQIIRRHAGAPPSPCRTGAAAGGNRSPAPRRSPRPPPPSWRRGASTERRTPR